MHLLGLGQEFIQPLLDGYFVKLAHAGFGYLINEGNEVRQHPFGHLTLIDTLGFQEFQYISLFLRGARDKLDKGHWPLSPFFIGHANIGGFQNKVSSGRKIL